jgi:hypothetical protein
MANVEGRAAATLKILDGKLAELVSCSFYVDEMGWLHAAFLPIVDKTPPI